jgi:hypothetical protein
MHPILLERKGIRARKWKQLAVNFRVTLRDVFVFAFIMRDNRVQSDIYHVKVGTRL